MKTKGLLLRTNAISNSSQIQIYKVDLLNHKANPLFGCGLPPKKMAFR